MNKNMSLVMVMCLSSAAMAAVPRPWTPVKTAGTTVSVWGRDYAFASNALPVSVKACGEELLAGPMRVVSAGVDGREAAWKRGGSWVVSCDDEAAVVSAWQESEVCSVDVTARVEFDGMMKVTMSVVASKDQALRPFSKVWLEIPMRPEFGKLFTSFPRTWGRLDNCGAITEPRAWPFRASMWLGNEEKGLCWFCESDRTFLSADRNRVIEVVPGEKETVLRVHIADGFPQQVPAVWTFGLQATPVKPFDRARNANHFYHTDRLAETADGKRVDLWMTTKEGFDEAAYAARLDRIAKSGAKTIVFHEQWVPAQNFPKPFPGFKGLIDACHRRGLKVLIYQGYELSPFDPCWGEFYEKGLARDKEGLPLGLWCRQPAQRDYPVCYASGFDEIWLARMREAFEAYGLDGVYLDGTIMPMGCANTLHGCGWRDAAGYMHETYPIFAYRKMMRALYEYVDARGGIIDAHQSGYVCPATLAFAHTYWDGEQLAFNGGDIKKQLDLNSFRAEFMGRNYGVACEFLAYPKEGWTMDNALAIALLHDVLPRARTLEDLDLYAPVWKALDDFGATEAEWTPYWKEPIATHSDDVKSSVYRRNGATLAVVSNIGSEKAKVALDLPAGAAKVTDARTGTELPVDGGKVSVELEPFAGRLLLMK